jgi:hypothetical protein
MLAVAFRGFTPAYSRKASAVLLPILWKLSVMKSLRFLAVEAGFKRENPNRGIESATESR